MKELIIKIKYDDQGGYEGHGTAEEVILNSMDVMMMVDLEQENVIKSNWSIEVIK